MKALYLMRALNVFALSHGVVNDLIGSPLGSQRAGNCLLLPPWLVLKKTVK